MSTDPTRERLCIRTRELPDGRLLETWLLHDDAGLFVMDPSEEEGAAEPPELPVSAEAIEAVFSRYGRPLEAPLPPAETDDALVRLRFANAPSATLRAFEYRAPVDVIPNDWLVLERVGRDPIAAPAKLVGAALVAIARAYDAKARGGAN